MSRSGSAEVTGALDSIAARVCAVDPGQAARDLADQSILDTAACIMAGWQTPQRRAVSAMLERSGNRGAGARALLLGTAAHALDYDDFEQPGSTHPSAVLVPAILAVAASEEVTRAGAEAAYVAGYEVILSLGLALGYGHYMAGWHATGTLGLIGAAGTAAHLLGLDRAATVTALSLAMTKAAGLKVQFGADAKAAHAGLAARGGVDAAYLAAAGLGAAPDAFDAPKGFAALYAPGPASAPPLASILDHPPYRKLSPACGYTLRAIEAACEITQQPGFAAAAIEAVEIEIAEPYHDVAGNAAPATGHEARFSVTWCVACALTDGQVGLGHFTDQALSRPDLRALERRIRVQRYALPDGAGDVSPEAPERVTVQLMDGRTHHAACAVQKGGPGRPLDPADLMAKLADCGMTRAVADSFLAHPGTSGFSGAQILPPDIVAALP